MNEGSWRDWNDGDYNSDGSADYAFMVSDSVTESDPESATQLNLDFGDCLLPLDPLELNSDSLSPECEQNSGASHECESSSVGIAITSAKHTIIDSAADLSKCHRCVLAVAHAIGIVRPERGTVLAIFAVLVCLTRARTVCEDALCSELGVSKRTLLKYRYLIQSALTAPSQHMDPLAAILAAQLAVATYGADVLTCESDLRKVAFALGAKCVEHSTLIAIMAALACITDGLPPAVAQIQYPGAKVRNVQQWKRKMLTVLTQSAQQMDLGDFTAAELDSLV